MSLSGHVTIADGHTAQMNLFQNVLTDTSINSISYQSYRPLGQINGTSQIEFLVNNSSNIYFDLQKTMLKVKVRLLKDNGDSVDTTDILTGPVNCLHSALFSQADLLLNGTLVSKVGDPFYAYSGYIDRLLNYSDSEKQSFLQTELYANDDPGRFEADVGIVNTSPVTTTNTEAVSSSTDKDEGGSDSSEGSDNNTPGYKIQNFGHRLRCERLNGGKTVELCGPVHIDFLKGCDRYLLNNTSIFLRFWQTADRFRIYSPRSTGERYKIEIVDCELILATCHVNSDVILAHSLALEEKPAIYPYLKDSFHMVTIAAGQFSVSIDNLYPKEIPSKIKLFFVASEAINGSYKRNPFHLENCDVETVSFTIDGNYRPTNTLITNFDDSNYSDAYLSQYLASCTYNQKGNSISYNDYAQGYCVFCIDTAIGIPPESNYNPKPKTGNCRLDVKFRHALKESYTLCVWSQSKSIVLIDKTRNVIV